MEEKNEQVAEKATQDNITKVEIKQEQQDDDVIKVNLDKPTTPKEEKNETKEDNADNSGVATEPENADASQEQEEVQPEAETQEAPVLEEITEDSTEEEVACLLYTSPSPRDS